MNDGYRITYDEDADGNPVLRYSGDVQSLVDACAEDVTHRKERGFRELGPKAGFRKVLAVDPVTLMDVAQKNGLDYFDPAVFDMCSGRDYSKFRCIDDKRYWLNRGRKRIITLG